MTRHLVLRDVGVHQVENGMGQGAVGGAGVPDGVWRGRVVEGMEHLGDGRELGSDGIYPYISLLNKQLSVVPQTLG